MNTRNENVNHSEVDQLGQLVELVSVIVADDSLHGRWLNSLSFLENSGARKISAAQHPELVTEQILRHTVEESRHAWYLKRQIRKLPSVTCPTYEPAYLVAPTATRQYLHKLDTAVSRLVKTELELVGQDLRSACYVLVTYAIEVKADLLYGNYERLLKDHKSEVSVRTILVDEENHLAEMADTVAQQFEDPQWWLEKVCEIEQEIFSNWLTAIEAEIQAETQDSRT